MDHTFETKNLSAGFAGVISERIGYIDWSCDEILAGVEQLYIVYVLVGTPASECGANRTTVCSSRGRLRSRLEASKANDGEQSRGLYRVVGVHGRVRAKGSNQNNNVGLVLNG